MRVALVVDRFPELSETFIAAEADALASLGHDVSVEAAFHADTPAESNRSASFWEDESRGVQVRSLAWLALRHPLRCLIDVLSRRRWRRQEDPRRLLTLAPAARRLRSSGVQHLHVHFAAGAALDALRIGALLRVPYSLMTHGYDIFRDQRNLLEKHERAEFAATPCDYSARWLLDEHGAQARKLVMGVDPETLVRSAPYPGGRTVVAIGRLVEKKGFAVLVEAASLESFDRVVIVGDGPERESLVSLADSLGVGDVVSLVGAQPPSEVRSLLEQADVLAAPCVVAPDGDRDTMPVVVKEALAMEVPAVVSDEVGLPEVVRPEWGRLVAPGDAAELAAALDEVLSLPVDSRVAMGRAGRAFVESECNVKTETERLAGWMADAVDGFRSAR